MQAANSWAGFMMSPAGVDEDGNEVMTFAFSPAQN